MGRRAFLTLASFASVGSASTIPALPHTVTFVMNMRQEIGGGRFDSTRDEVGVRGGVAPLSWDTTLLAADPDADGRYEVTVTFARAPFGGQAVTYKLENEKFVSGARQLRDALARKGWKTGTDLEYFEQEGGQHDEISWASRVEGMLVFLYGRRPTGER